MISPVPAIRPGATAAFAGTRAAERSRVPATSPSPPAGGPLSMAAGAASRMTYPAWHIDCRFRLRYSGLTPWLRGSP